MANLSLPTIAREERHQYRTALLVDKVFKLNIRNKQGGLYPSHLMLDYTSKVGTGKQQIN